MKNIQVKISDSNIHMNNFLNPYIASQNGYITSNIAMINPFTLWNKGYTGKDITVAIIDTGCCINHPDLKNNIIGSRNFTTESTVEDGSGHGTHVAGIVASNGYIKGVAPNSKLLILKVLESNGNGNLENVVNAINYAIDQKVNIINLSLGCKVDIPELHSAIKRAVNNNVMVCCAIGNEGDSNGETLEVSYPSYYPEVISVGSINNNKIHSSFSNSNYTLDIVAPGENVISTHLNNGYVELSGTSMSTPHVVGAIALLMERFKKEYKREPFYMEMYAQLIKNTVDMNTSRSLQGNGMLFLR